MKKFIKKSYLVTSVLLVAIVSCKKENKIPENTVTVQNFTSTINENPTTGQSIGTVQATGNGTLSYSITTQTPAAALTINSATGELTVTNATLFNFEINPVITATIEVNNSGTVKNLTATINVADVNEIGEYKFGGVIFWIDPTDNTNGMVCAIVNQISGIRWDNPNGPTTAVSGTSENFGTGSNNTNLIIAHEGAIETSYAAGVARAYNGGGFNDWFLPSSGEMLEMFNKKTVINATAVANGGVNIIADYYWSSTRQPNTLQSVYLFSFSSGNVNGGLPVNLVPVRAVRTF